MSANGQRWSLSDYRRVPEQTDGLPSIVNGRLLGLSVPPRAENVYWDGPFDLQDNPQPTVGTIVVRFTSLPPDGRFSARENVIVPSDALAAAWVGEPAGEIDIFYRTNECVLRATKPYSVLAHELGHALGFTHVDPNSPLGSDALMQPFPYEGRIGTFQDRIHMHHAYVVGNGAARTVGWPGGIPTARPFGLTRPVYPAIPRRPRLILD